MNTMFGRVIGLERVPVLGRSVGPAHAPEAHTSARISFLYIFWFVMRSVYPIAFGAEDPPTISSRPSNASTFRSDGSSIETSADGIRQIGSGPWGVRTLP